MPTENKPAQPINHYFVGKSFSKKTFTIRPSSFTKKETRPGSYPCGSVPCSLTTLTFLPINSLIVVGAPGFDAGQGVKSSPSFCSFVDQGQG